MLFQDIQTELIQNIGVSHYLTITSVEESTEIS
jgi:hypothetical protein